MGVTNRFRPRAVTRCFSSLDNRPHGGRGDTKVRIGRTHLRQHLSIWRCTYFAWGCFAKQSDVAPRGGALSAQFGRCAPRVQSRDLATVGRGAVTVTALAFLFALLRLCRVSSPWSQCANRAQDRSPQRADRLAAPHDLAKTRNLNGRNRVAAGGRRGETPATLRDRVHPSSLQPLG